MAITRLPPMDTITIRPAFSRLLPRTAQQNKKALRSLSIFAGIGLLGFMLMQQIFSAILMIFGLADLYQNDALFQDAYGILFSIFCVGLPFLAVYFLLALRRQAPDIPLNAPKNKWRAILLALIGLLVCMAGNYATNGLILFSISLALN